MIFNKVPFKHPTDSNNQCRSNGYKLIVSEKLISQDKSHNLALLSE